MQAIGCQNTSTGLGNTLGLINHLCLFCFRTCQNKSLVMKVIGGGWEVGTDKKGQAPQQGLFLGLAQLLAAGWDPYRSPEGQRLLSYGCVPPGHLPHGSTQWQ